MRQTVTYSTLPNGLRTVHIHRPGAAVAYCGLSIRAGSADEIPADGFPYGLAHFVEHCIFKGTETRSAEVLRNAMESVGGELNAYTDKDNTVVYAVAPRRYAERALALIADITSNSVFPASELDKEKEVVEAEIDSYLDTPSEQIFDDFEDLLLSATPLGHNILGRARDVRKFSGEQCLRWLRGCYTAQRCVLFYSGPMRQDRFLALAQSFFGCMAPSALSPVTMDTLIPGHPFMVERRRPGHQSHTVMGKALPAPSLEDSAAIQLLANILGGPGMNSLLNVEMREKRGLVYTVESSVVNYAQACVFTVYFGCDDAHASECRAIVNSTIESLAANPMSARAFAAARRQFLGQAAIAAENPENQATAIARATLLHGRALTRQEAVKLYRSLTPDDLCRVARTLGELSSLTFATH